MRWSWNSRQKNSNFRRSRPFGSENVLGGWLGFTEPIQINHFFFVNRINLHFFRGSFMLFAFTAVPFVTYSEDFFFAELFQAALSLYWKCIKLLHYIQRKWILAIHFKIKITISTPIKSELIYFNVRLEHQKNINW